jgi:hypothetical protein
MMQRQKLDKPTSESVAFAPQLIQKRPVAPVMPDEIVQISWNQIIVPGVGFAVSLILAIMGLAPAISVLLGIAAVGCGGTALFYGLKRYNQRDEIKAYRELICKYENEKDIYNSDMEEYEKCKKQMEDDGKAFFEDENGLFIKE